MNISHSLGSLDWQSANFPGKPPPSNTPLRRVKSLALRAASLALLERIPLSIIIRPVVGFSSKNSLNFSFTIDSTIPWTSLVTNLSLACDEKEGSGCLMLTTAVKPSRISSPERFPTFLRSSLEFP